MLPRIGYIRDPEDKRDGVFSWSERYGGRQSISAEVNLWRPGMLIRNQGQTNACTGYAGATAMQIAVHTDVAVDTGPLSGLFLYYIGRSVWGGESQDDGSYLRTLFKAMQLQGACVEKVFTAEAGVFKKPTWRAVKNGFRHRGVRSYRKIYNVDEARMALSRGIPLVGGWDVGSEFVNWRGGEAYNSETDFMGGHAMCVVGYDLNGDFIVANSWGVNGGEKGFWRVTPEFLMSGDRLWACDTEEDS